MIRKKDTQSKENGKGLMKELYWLKTKTKEAKKEDCVMWRWLNGRNISVE